MGKEGENVAEAFLSCDSLDEIGVEAYATVDDFFDSFDAFEQALNLKLKISIVCRRTLRERALRALESESSFFTKHGFSDRLNEGITFESIKGIEGYSLQQNNIPGRKVRMVMLAGDMPELIFTEEMMQGKIPAYKELPGVFIDTSSEMDLETFVFRGNQKCKLYNANGYCAEGIVKGLRRITEIVKNPDCFEQKKEFLEIFDGVIAN